MKGSGIEEMQGLYGPFTISERVLQKIWLRQDFEARGLRAASGRKLEILDPGRWNLQEGPDFKEASFRLDGELVCGDVEVHFEVGDWRNHGHDRNSGFAKVVLHVVLHAPREKQLPSVENTDGRTPELLVLLPLLDRDLESYAADEALRELERADEPEWVAEFLGQSLGSRLKTLYQLGMTRWEQKAGFAAKRLERMGWNEACHQSCLEALGYARNRASMSRLAVRYPLERFRRGDLDPDSLYQEEAAYWKLSGVRPANHPRTRLRQYCKLVAGNPDWPEKLAARLCSPSLVGNKASGSEKTSAFRRAAGLPKLCKILRESVLAGQFGERRCNTLICDGALPLASAAGLLKQAPAYWWHWPPGDSPEALNRFLRNAGITCRERPQANGWRQGALALTFCAPRKM
ncbi:MAG: DUF2851 family protein [Opitutales bacterium]